MCIFTLIAGAFMSIFGAMMLLVPHPHNSFVPVYGLSALAIGWFSFIGSMFALFGA